MRCAPRSATHARRRPARSQHGVWFDIGEITDVLRKSGKIGPEETARQDKESTGSKVAEGATGVGAAILEVLGTAIDIVT